MSINSSLVHGSVVVVVVVVWIEVTAALLFPPVRTGRLSVIPGNKFGLLIPLDMLPGEGGPREAVDNHDPMLLVDVVGLVAWVRSSSFEEVGEGEVGDRLEDEEEEEVAWGGGGSADGPDWGLIVMGSTEDILCSLCSI